MLKNIVKCGELMGIIINTLKQLDDKIWFIVGYSILYPVVLIFEILHIENQMGVE